MDNSQADKINSVLPEALIIESETFRGLDYIVNGTSFIIHSISNGKFAISRKCLNDFIAELSSLADTLPYFTAREKAPSTTAMAREQR